MTRIDIAEELELIAAGAGDVADAKDLAGRMIRAGAEWKGMAIDIYRAIRGTELDRPALEQMAARIRADHSAAEARRAHTERLLDDPAALAAELTRFARQTRTPAGILLAVAGRI